VALLESVTDGDLTAAEAADLAEWMHTANLAKLRQTEARTDRLIDQIATRKAN
jgi:hypothetical protein